MECTTIREGYDCKFMLNKGCRYKKGFCFEIIDQCKGCKRSKEFSSGFYCSAYPEPQIKWKNGNCNLATHIILSEIKKKIKINPLKASKRSKR